MNALVYIWSDEHNAYWMAEGHGYTWSKKDAGLFEPDKYKYLLGPSYRDKQIKFIPAAPEFEI